MLDHTNLNNMQQFLAHLRKRPAEKILLKYMEGLEVKQLRSGEFFQAMDQWAALLNKHSLSGKHVGLSGSNRPQWLACLCALFQIGAVPVLLQTDLTAADLADKIFQTDIHCILCDDALLSTVQEAAEIADIRFLSMDQKPAVNADEAWPSDFPEPAATELGCILFTSGSTAQAKSVMLSQKALVAGICHNVIGQTFESQLAILPMHHLAGFATVLNSWYLNRVICLGTDYKYLFRYLEQMQPDYTSVVPSMLHAIVRKLKKGGPNGKYLGWNLQYIGCGGAQFPPDVIQPLLDRNIRIFQGYGASEMGSIGFIREMTTEQNAPCIGYPPPGMDVKIQDQELYVRSASVMMGYYGNAEETMEVLQDGWYRTGDLAYQDPDGRIYLTGRRKNVIILSNGENVSPEEIEYKLSSSSSIEEIVVGAQGDRIAAWIYPAGFDEQTLSQVQTAIDAYNHYAPTYKQIRVIQYLDTPIPKNKAGKPLRRLVTGEIINETFGTETTDH